MLGVQLAVVLAEEPGKSLPVGVGHVEDEHEILGVAPSPVQRPAHEIAHVGPGDLALHEQGIHGRPEAFAGHLKACEELLARARPAGLASRRAARTNTDGEVDRTDLSPGTLATSRSTTLRSWLTLPGHEYDWSAARASRENFTSRLVAAVAANRCSSNGMSSERSLRVGTGTEVPANRSHQAASDRRAGAILDPANA